MLLKKIQDRLARKRRIRAKIDGTAVRPRMTVYRSLTNISVQLIDDEAGRTLCSASTKEVKAKPTIDGARKVGELIAKKATDAGINAVTFDRNAYKYHGRIKSLADAAREGGLQF